MKWLRYIGYIGAVIIVSLLWTAAPLEIAVWGTFALMCFLFAVPVQIVGVTAMSLLMMVAVTQTYEPLSIYSERLAVYVFYLLCIMVALQLRHLWQHQELEPVLPPGTLFIPKRIISADILNHEIKITDVGAAAVRRRHRNTPKHADIVPRK